MNQHEKVWNALDVIANSRGLTASGLARMAGLDATAFNPSKRSQKGRQRWPSTETIAKVLETTGLSWYDFACVVEHGAKAVPKVQLVIEYGPHTDSGGPGREFLIANYERPKDRSTNP